MSKLMKLTLIAMCLLGLTGGFVTLNTVHADVAASNPIPYNVETRPSGYLRVRVNADLRDLSQRENYALAQRTAVANLLAAGQAEGVSIQVTFSQPISVEELRDLSTRTGLSSAHLILVAKDATGALYAIGKRAIPSAIVNVEELNPELVSRGLSLLGVAVVQGKIRADQTGIGQLANDTRVYLADITSHTLAKEVAAKNGVSVDKVQVSVPTPYWDLLTSGR